MKGVNVSGELQAALEAGYEPGDGSMNGAMRCGGRWWHPKHGCESLQAVLEVMQGDLEVLAMKSEGKCVCDELRRMVFGG